VKGKHDMEISIVEATTDDAGEILALQKVAYQSEAKLYGDPGIPPLTQTLADLEAELQTMIFLKAVWQGRIIGSVRGSLVSATCLIGRLIVHPNCQRRGVGTALMKSIEKAFGTAERFELFTGTRSSSNIRLYRKLGYEECREDDLSREVRLVFMEKRRERQSAMPGGT
jgi:ribosomal protein S18 acetylase RimI-like enzyme